MPLQPELENDSVGPHRYKHAAPNGANGFIASAQQLVKTLGEDI